MLRLRGVVAPLAAAGLIAAAAACGSALSNGAFGGPEDGGVGFDSGTVSSDGSFDSGASGPDSSSADSGVPLQTGALFVNAISASPPSPLDLRLCWKVDDAEGGAGAFSNTDVPFPSGTPAPESNYPAVPIGGATALADASSLVGSNLTIVAIPASAYETLEKNTTPPFRCGTVLGSGSNSIVGVIETYTFTVPAGIVPGSTSVIAFAGCPANDPNGSIARCGAGWTSASGNLHVDVVPLYPVDAGGGGQLGVQLAQLSPGLAQLAGDAGAVVSFGPQGATTPVATLAGEGSSAPATAMYLTVGTDAGAYDTLGFGVDVTGSDGGPGHLWMSLEQSLDLAQGPMVNPAVYYSVADTYVVAVVGDPSAAHAFAPDASFDGTGLHVLVIPL
jgi:hypothetical protein